MSNRVILIAVSYRNEFTCSIACHTYDIDVEDDVNCLNYICKMQNLQVDEVDEVLVIQDGNVTQYGGQNGFGGI